MSELLKILLVGQELLGVDRSLAYLVHRSGVSPATLNATWASFAIWAVRSSAAGSRGGGCIGWKTPTPCSAFCCAGSSWSGAGHSWSPENALAGLAGALLGVCWGQAGQRSDRLTPAAFNKLRASPGVASFTSSPGWCLAASFAFSLISNSGGCMVELLTAGGFS